MELPRNFDAYTSVITYLRSKGLDCLSSLQEQFRFYIVYILGYNFRATSLKYKNDKEWGKLYWRKFHHGFDIMNTTLTYKDIEIKISNGYMLEKLQNADLVKIEQYFQDLFPANKSKILYVNQKQVMITNPFNDSKIIVSKDRFVTRCEHYQKIRGQKISTISIPVLFNDDTGLYIAKILMDNEIAQPHTIDMITQSIEVMEYLGIMI